MIDIGWNIDGVDGDRVVGRLFEAAFGDSMDHFDQLSLCGWKPIAESGSQPQEVVWNGGMGFVFDRLGVSEHDHVDTEIFETFDDIVIRVVIPGIKKESLFIEVNGNILTLTGERTTDEDEFSETGQSLMPFKKVFSLPKTPVPGEIRAKYTGTILHIQIAKNLA